jgi:hypothetical protein
MTPCKTIHNCQVFTSYNHNGVLVSVGITKHEEEEFFTCCIQDPLTGCQHICTKQHGALILVENVVHALLMKRGRL